MKNQDGRFWSNPEVTPEQDKAQKLMVYNMNLNLGRFLLNHGELEDGKRYLLIARECRRVFHIAQTV